MTGKRTRIRVLPASWPLGRSENLPGRLRIIAPQMIMAPWELGTPDETYAFPGGVVGDEQDPNSGAVERLAFFPTFRIDRDSFSLLLSRLGVQTVDKTFAAFGCRARHKSYAHSLVTYLVQMRFVTQAALKEVFGIGPSSEDKRITEQSVDIGEAMWSFVQRRKNASNPVWGLFPTMWPSTWATGRHSFLPTAYPTSARSWPSEFSWRTGVSASIGFWSRLAMLTK